MEELRTIVYVSSAVKKLSDPDLEALLAVSRRCNRENGITGVLLYHDGSFMQCFEGPAKAVVATRERIYASKMHTGIVELMNDPVPARSFEAFEMGLAQPTASQLVALSTARWKQRDATADPSGAESPGFKLLREFWRNARG